MIYTAKSHDGINILCCIPTIRARKYIENRDGATHAVDIAMAYQHGHTKKMKIKIPKPSIALWKPICHAEIIRIHLSYFVSLANTSILVASITLIEEDLLFVIVVDFMFYM